MPWRHVDESGGEYPCPTDFFATARLPTALRRAVLATV